MSSSASITTNSGPLDVQGLVSQLMSVASRPLTASQSRVKTYNAELSSIGSLSSDLSSLQTSMTALSSGSFLQQYAVSSSDEATATATTSAGAMPGTYTINTTALASPRQLVFDEKSDGSAITDPNAAISGAPVSLSFNIGGSVQTVNVVAGSGGNISMNDLQSQINSAGIGVDATIVKSNGHYKLVLASHLAGKDNSFSLVTGAGTVDAPAGSAASLDGLTQSSTGISESSAAGDAAFTVNGVGITSSSNQVGDAVSGLNLSLNKIGSATLTVTQDAKAVESNVKDFVSAYNSVQTQIGLMLDGNMKANGSLRSMRNTLQNMLQVPISGVDSTTSYAYLAQVGITTQKDGTLALDSAKFQAALSAKPEEVSRLFSNSNNDGVAQRYNTTINDLLGPDGIVLSEKAAINSSIDSEKQQQDRLTSNLTHLQAQYLKQYSDLNSALEKMQQTSSQMSSMLASSSSSSSG
ncbi:flagellar filament capping protein FliD [Paludibacterium yongneupense]|uniref:flagellar filament capping protein FliD n=1 Tax=Paludibacterium yongneupense TaxID=400061 RepID=UPI0003F56F48|nr:flagellar filament capping protein FliD [Paludibacterium yongneupense]